MLGRRHSATSLLIVTKSIESLRNTTTKGVCLAQVAYDEFLPPSTVSSILKRFEDTGSACSQSTGGVREPPKLNKRYLQHVEEFYRRENTATFRKAQEDLLEAFPLLKSISKAALCQQLNKNAHFALKVTHKAVKDQNSSRKIKERRHWVSTNNTEINWSEAVFLDECSFNLATIRRTRRAPKGERAVTGHKPRGENFSLLVAVSADCGMIAYESLLDHHTSERFIAFIQDKLMPELRSPRTLIMDNDSWHHSESTKAILEKDGHHIIFQPPYTPQV